MGLSSWFLSCKRLKLTLKVFSAGHIVAIVTYNIKRMTATCSPMIVQLYDFIIVAPLSVNSGSIYPSKYSC